MIFLKLSLFVFELLCGQNVVFLMFSKKKKVYMSARDVFFFICGTLDASISG